MPNGCVTSTRLSARGKMTNATAPSSTEGLAIAPSNSYDPVRVNWSPSKGGATPAIAVLVATPFIVPPTGPVSRLREMASAEWGPTVITAPSWSRMETTGDVARSASVSTSPPGCVSNTTLSARPKMSNGTESTAGMLTLDGTVARSTSPSWTTLNVRPEKQAATPAVAGQLKTPPSTPPPPIGSSRMESIDSVPTVTVEPKASRSSTTGCVGRTTPSSTSPTGSIVKTISVASGKIVNGALVINSDGAATVASIVCDVDESVNVPTRSEKLAVPATAVCSSVPVRPNVEAETVTSRLACGPVATTAKLTSRS